MDFADRIINIKYDHGLHGKKLPVGRQAFHGFTEAAVVGVFTNNSNY